MAPNLSKVEVEEKDLVSRGTWQVLVQEGGGGRKAQ